MPWCHTCRVEYEGDPPECIECGGLLVAAPAPERRLASAGGGRALAIVATLPPEEALLASGRLDDGGIPASLRPASEDRTAGDEVFHVLVSQDRAADARSLLIRSRKARDPAHSATLTAIAVVTGIALMLSAVMLVVRWALSGSPLPR